MGDACPVCETPHPDAEHLANHLAFTAMLGDDDHEAWLDEHAPGWEEEGEAELAERVADHAPEVGFPQVFDDTTPDHDHSHGDEPRGGGLFEDELERANARGRGSMAGGADGRAGAGGRGGALDGEAQEILQEAQELTREMLDDESEDDGESSSDDDGEPGSKHDGETTGEDDE